jgi:hypothetical protein
MPRFDEGVEITKLEYADILLTGNPGEYSKILAQNILVEDITRASLQTLITNSRLVRGKLYRITDAVGSTLSIIVQALTANTLGDISYNSATGDIYTYSISTDTGSVGLNLGENGLNTGFVTYDTTPTNTPTSQATTYWDSTEETLALIMNGVTQRVGLDTFFNAKNSTGTSIPKGTAVRFAGTDGNSGNLLIAPMLADGTYPSVYYMGITAEVIGNGQFGKVMFLGKLSGINTNAYVDGDILYVSSTVAGGFQTTAPLAPNNIIIAAAVVNAANNGVLEVRATLGSNINNDEGVKITTPLTGQLLQLQSNGLWENKTLPIHDAVTLGTANGLSLAGQVLSLGLSSSSANGALSSTDWSTFNAKQAALNGTGFVKISGTTISYDNSTYLTGNQTITLSGEASGSGATSISVTLDNAAVINKVLTGLSVSGSAIVSTDSILVALGKVQNQINALAGGVSYQGTWNASTNTPALTSSVGTKGYYYVVSVAGSTNLNGITDWKLGDWVIFNGSTWDKVDNTDAVISVNGYTGIVTLAKADIGLGNVENTALSTWAGSNSITTLGTIGTGVWQGTAIGDTYISSATTWNAKIGGSGTSGKLAKFTASGTVGDSAVTENGTFLTFASGSAVNDTVFKVQQTTNSTAAAIQIAANNDGGAAYNFISSITNSGTTHWKLWGGAALGTLAIDTNGTTRVVINSTGQIITNLATNTGEHFIVGGSARVNGNATITDLVIVGNNIGYGGITPNGNAGVTSTIESHNGSQIASRIVVPQLYISSNVVGSPFSPTRAVDGYATQLQLESFGGNINLNVAGTGLAGSAITWATALNITSTGAATFSSSVGIGTTGTLANRLQVQNGTAANTLVQIHSFGLEAAGEYAGVLFKSAATSNNEYGKGLIAYRNNGTGYGRGDLYFALNNDIDTANASLANAKMVITSAGNVIIGGTSGAVALNVLDSANTYSAHFSGLSQTNGVAIGTDSSNVALIQGYTKTFSGTNNISLQSAGGNVGIGTTTPSEQLEVQNGTAGTKIKVSNTGGGYAQLEISSNATSVAQLTFTNALTVTGGSVTFGSSIAIGNTVTTSVATASTHKVEMVIGGVTYYLLATT